MASDTPRTDALLREFEPADTTRELRLAELARQLEREVKSLEGFADLWYFAMDQAAGDFERIVTTCSPSSWMYEIGKLRRGESA